MIERIACSVSELEKEAFRIMISKRFVDSSNPYQMDIVDKMAEVKAFFVLVALMAIVMDSKEEKEPEDVTPFLKACMDSVYFGSSFRALGGLFFGVATNKVSSIAG